MSRRSEIVFSVAALVLAVMLFVSCGKQEAGLRPLGEVDGVPFVEMRAERLAELPKARGGHHTMLLGDELTVFGGITDGYVLEPTIAYLKNGVWHEVPMNYPHYYGFTTLLPDGKVMLGGGCDENFGIGQSWGVEVYDPATHSCKAAGILSRKRAGLSAMAFPDGRVVISGNWYAHDDIEIYEPGAGFSHLKESATQRTYPFILQSSADNAIIFSGRDTSGAQAAAMVDRVYGEAFYVPLLEQWEALPGDLIPCSGDELRIGDYTYLVPVTSFRDGSFAILKVAGEQFSLLDTDHPIPMATPDGASMQWENHLIVDHSGRKAWVQGYDDRCRYYAACIDYDATLDGGKASIRVYRAEDHGSEKLGSTACLLPGGRLAFTGGVEMLTDPPRANNFESGAEVWLFHTEPVEKAAMPWWGWLLGCGLIAGSVICAAVLLRGRGSKEQEVVSPAVDENKLRADLMEQMLKLIEEEELFKRKDLHMEDIARELATNRTYISMLLNNMSGTKFTDLVNGYRIRYAQKLLRENPGMHLDDIADASGFSSRTAFFRNFKAQTGMAPMEWLKKEGGSGE